MAKVLVIEDNATNITLAVFLLEAVLSATRVGAGLTLARDQHPNLIVMDIQLPGMDGLEATVLLKRDDDARVRDTHGPILFWHRGAEVTYGWLSK